MSGGASATILFDLDGTCTVDCARLGIADGAVFSEPGALGLFDGTNTSNGSDLLLSDIELFTFFGFDFLAGNTVLMLSTPGMGFIADNVLGGFVLVGGTNGFCYQFTGATCEGARFDTIVGSSGVASGSSGHGPAQFTRSSIGTVPAPATLALFVVGIVGLGWSRRK